MGEEKAVEKFDPATIMQSVKDKIKATFVSLIPDVQWEQMVKSEVDYLFKKKDGNYYSRQYSEFEALINTTIHEECKKRLIAYLSSPEFEIIWGANGQPVASETIKKLVIDNSGEILAQTFAGMFANMLLQFRGGLINKQY